MIRRQLRRYTPNNTSSTLATFRDIKLGSSKFGGPMAAMPPHQRIEVEGAVDTRHVGLHRQQRSGSHLQRLDTGERGKVFCQDISGRSKQWRWEAYEHDIGRHYRWHG